MTIGTIRFTDSDSGCEAAVTLEIGDKARAVLESLVAAAEADEDTPYGAPVALRAPAISDPGRRSTGPTLPALNWEPEVIEDLTALDSFGWPGRYEDEQGNYIRAYRAGERLHADFVASLAAEDEEEPLGRWADEVAAARAAQAERQAAAAARAQQEAAAAAAAAVAVAAAAGAEQGAGAEEEAGAEPAADAAVEAGAEQEEGAEREPGAEQGQGQGQGQGQAQPAAGGGQQEQGAADRTEPEQAAAAAAASLEQEQEASGRLRRLTEGAMANLREQTSTAPAAGEVVAAGATAPAPAPRGTGDPTAPPPAFLTAAAQVLGEGSGEEAESLVALVQASYRRPGGGRGGQISRGGGRGGGLGGGLGGAGRGRSPGSPADQGDPKRPCLPQSPTPGVSETDMTEEGWVSGSARRHLTYAAASVGPKI
ncbi:hypothetical protein HYH03_003504 [Edaphochlamys debaryana]|uniref:Uncharacterized protein n=1 Tax=Edaphochlamys debaryana TaxID=47281 RepID=A0A835Y9G0_9CHLO|nr:hypothetical protein HYH03_003504 [Edaphochlamys debaryana]|eukprot:KAG2498765.1 hypothetical protein HYH03_003504 [Edaphochlamys debaryana]